MLRLDGLTALVLAPHPDDEVFGCGGLIYRLKAAGSRVYVLYMTVGTTADFSPKGCSTAEERVEEVKEVAAFFELDGYRVAFPGDDSHLKLDARPMKDLVHAIERGPEISLEALRPDVVLTPQVSDYNQDHRVVSEATIAAARPGSPTQKHLQPVVLGYELPYHQWNLARSLPAPSLLVRLDERAANAKRRALELYRSQLKAPDSPLSLHGTLTLMTYRGLACGAPAAEAFMGMRVVL